MVKKLLLVAILFTGLVACKSKSAFNFSEQIVAKERSLEPEITATENKVEKFAQAGQFDSMAAVSDRMEKLVQTKIDEIEDMKVPNAKEADAFKSATLKYFKYIKSIYTGYKGVGNAKTDEEREELASDLMELANKKNAVLSDMQAAQQKYAKANGFKVEK